MERTEQHIRGLYAASQEWKALLNQYVHIALETDPWLRKHFYCTPYIERVEVQQDNIVLRLTGLTDSDGGEDSEEITIPFSDLWVEDWVVVAEQRAEQRAFTRAEEFAAGQREEARRTEERERALLQRLQAKYGVDEK